MLYMPVFTFYPIFFTLYRYFIWSAKINTVLSIC